MEWPLPAIRRGLGRLNYEEAFLGVFSSLQASNLATRGSRLLNFLWDAQIGEGLTCAKCSVILGFNDFKRLH